jgi:hypothetical protein
VSTSVRNGPNFESVEVEVLLESLSKNMLLLREVLQLEMTKSRLDHHLRCQYHTLTPRVRLERDVKNDNCIHTNIIHAQTSCDELFKLGVYTSETAADEFSPRAEHIGVLAPA